MHPSQGHQSPNCRRRMCRHHRSFRCREIHHCCSPPASLPTTLWVHLNWSKRYHLHGCYAPPPPHFRHQPEPEPLRHDITENIQYGNESVSEVDIRKAAKAANVHEFVMSLPQGYDTMLGENAPLISGGQAQRLQIARALARPAKVLILDECTSALDLANQAAVLDTVKEAKLIHSSTFLWACILS
jgi:ABC transporter